MLSRPLPRLQSIDARRLVSVNPRTVESPGGTNSRMDDPIDDFNSKVITPSFLLSAGVVTRLAAGHP